MRASREILESVTLMLDAHNFVWGTVHKEVIGGSGNCGYGRVGKGAKG